MCRERNARELLVLIFVVMTVVGLVGCGSSSNDRHAKRAVQRGHPEASQQAAKRAEQQRRERARTRARARARARHRAAHQRQVAALGCPDPGRVLDGVYHPDRLAVHDPCRKITGTVILVRSPEDDGDLHFDVRLDNPDGMLMENNRTEQSGGLVVEFMPRDHGHFTAPSPGDRVTLVGAYVDDTEHAWSELHPVWAESINGGQVMRSGAQFGGSPPSAYSDNALSSCHTNTGARCVGWGGTTASSPSPQPSPPSSGGGGGGGGNCTPGYSPCIPPGPDVDCLGGGGDGPRYVQGPVHVTGSDPYDLDSDGNGVGCQ